MRIYRYILALLTSARNLVCSFTLFESDDPNDAYTIRTNILTTRLYLGVLTIAMISFSISILATTETSRITVDNPTMAIFERLHIKYANTLACPCTQLSIQYRQVLSIDPVYHPVCSSMLLSPAWIGYLSRRSSTMFHQFLLLKYLCQSAHGTVRASLQAFLDDSFVTGDSLSRFLFRSQIRATMSDVFQSTTEGAFKRTLDLIRTNTHANQLLSGLFTNWKIRLACYDDEDSCFTRNRPVRFVTNVTCACHISPTCKTQHRFNHSVSGQTFYVPRFYYGCVTVESLLQSTLECFYNQTCLDTLVEHLDSAQASSLFVAMASDGSSAVNETVESIVGRVMVNGWQSSISFENYYQTCNPSSCSYAINRTHTLGYLVPAFIALYGGLIYILDLFIPLAMRAIRWRRRNRVSTQQCRRSSHLRANLTVY